MMYPTYIGSKTNPHGKGQANDSSNNCSLSKDILENTSNEKGRVYHTLQPLIHMCISFIYYCSCRNSREANMTKFDLPASW